MRIGAQHFDAETYALTGDAAAHPDASSGAQTWQLGRIEFEPDRRPRLARVDNGQRFEDAAWLGAHGDPGTPNTFFPPSTHVVGRAG